MSLVSRSRPGSAETTPEVLLMLNLPTPSPPKQKLAICPAEYLTRATHSFLLFVCFRFGNSKVDLKKTLYECYSCTDTLIFVQIYFLQARRIRYLTKAFEKPFRNFRNSHSCKTH